MKRMSGGIRRDRILRTSIFLICLLGMLGAARAELRAQQEPKIEVNVKTVNVEAVVRDKHGKIVTDLAADAFVLEEDGRSQKINYFAKEGDLPLRLGLLVDTSRSQRQVIGAERTASYSFVDHVLREHKDLVTVINFDRDVTLLQEFT